MRAVVRYFIRIMTFHDINLSVVQFLLFDTDEPTPNTVKIMKLYFLSEMIVSITTLRVKTFTRLDILFSNPSNIKIPGWNWDNKLLLAWNYFKLINYQRKPTWLPSLFCKLIYLTNFYFIRSKFQMSQFSIWQNWYLDRFPFPSHYPSIWISNLFHKKYCSQRKEQSLF